jgi:hypothetical protein
MKSLKRSSLALLGITLALAACSDSNPAPGATPNARLTLNSPTAVKFTFRFRNGKPAQFRDLVDGKMVNGKCSIDVSRPKHGLLRPVIVEYDAVRCQAVVEYGDWDNPSEPADTAKATSDVPDAGGAQAVYFNNCAGFPSDNYGTSIRTRETNQHAYLYVKVNGVFEELAHAHLVMNWYVATNPNPDPLGDETYYCAARNPNLLTGMVYSLPGGIYSQITHTDTTGSMWVNATANGYSANPILVGGWVGYRFTNASCTGTIYIGKKVSTDWVATAGFTHEIAQYVWETGAVGPSYYYTPNSTTICGLEFQVGQGLTTGVWGNNA